MDSLWTKVQDNSNEFADYDGQSPLRGAKMQIAEIPEAQVEHTPP
jgi:hypothetical protein